MEQPRPNLPSVPNHMGLGVARDLVGWDQDGKGELGWRCGCTLTPGRVSCTHIKTLLAAPGEQIPQPLCPWTLMGGGVELSPTAEGTLKKPARSISGHPRWRDFVVTVPLPTCSLKSTYPCSR